jgi:uncharacterized protein
VSASFATQLGGLPAVLRSDRSLWLPSWRALLIADLHLGKGDAFRRGGIAIPTGATESDLSRLGAALSETGAAELWILGDFVHGALNDAAWKQAWQDFRVAHASVRVHLVAGNHDRRLNPHTVAPFALELHTAAVQRDGLLLDHEVACPLRASASSLVFPLRASASSLVFPLRASAHSLEPQADVFSIGGHVHPGVALPRLGRFPVFALAADHLLLPAFASFSGTHLVNARDYRRFACAEGSVLAVDSSR